MLRLFIAIELPSTFKDQLAGLKTSLVDATWAKRDTFHLTLRFLGDHISQARVSELDAVLRPIQVSAFDVELRGVGRFPPNPKRPARVLWVGMTPQPTLTALYREIERAVTSIGFAADDHDFNPHITLARLKHDQPDPAVSQFLQQNADFRAQAFHAGDFKLFSSTLTPQGAVYRVVSSYPLNQHD